MNKIGLTAENKETWKSLENTVSMLKEICILVDDINDKISEIRNEVESTLCWRIYNEEKED